MMPSHKEGSFEYPQHMFWMENEENNFPIRTLIWGPDLIKMKKVNKQCLLDTPRTVRVSEKTWQVIVQTSRP